MISLLPSFFSFFFSGSLLQTMARMVFGERLSGQSEVQISAPGVDMSIMRNIKCINT